ncbi:RING-type domain-containing protein [Chloropicon primus]|uniref:RING-type domain-containing protein n=1 Tax=Chloropicon primus TaxID=1764295 RepID=A0A5B8MUV6_9CHLO|nr:hypothetical protein A3770_12p66550 [Chloropicon primus]UPR03346.1 RING-type domain-containing protein [Chloropicon primus]|mmetsp:Transcript_5916/g.17801  ORF Transcript_5916/g.17801 Transcript_5916/m.17801 type:complete len:168 (-) Transcript_5916:141-644(-)|eukprot:QDZ24137.1 hypothetical protein A3770_12p66550 [Chloropicon primus]
MTIHPNNLFQTPERVSAVFGDGEAGAPGASTSSCCKAERKRRLDFEAGEGKPCECRTCAICLSPLKKKDGSEHKGETFVTPCDHEFHLKCLQSCREFKSSTCPLCRAKLPPGLTPVGARERWEERSREEELAHHFNLNAEYNANYIAMRAARIRLAVAQRYVQTAAS